jgi:Sigma-70 region 2
MHAPLRSPDQSEQVHQTWRHRDGAPHYFNSNLAREWIESYNQTGDQDSLCRFLEHAEPLVRSVIEYRNTVRHESADELLSRIRIKLWRSLKLFDPGKGSAFSFCAKIISSTSASAVAEAWARSERFAALNEQADSVFQFDPVASNNAIADIEARVRRIRTPCTDPSELAAQKWLISSFIDAEFGLRRCDASNAMMSVHGLTHAQSRRLFDLTLVSIRRELLTDRRLALIRPSSLARTRSEAIVRYARFLSAEEFTRLAVLLKDIAPSVVLTIDPSRACAIRRGCVEAVRANVNLILNGSATDRRLFA